MAMTDIIRDKVTAALSPVSLEIEDESARHHGHAGAQPGGESHFRLRIVSEKFAGLSRVARQRLVHAALADELKMQIHALSLVTLTPDEAARP